MVKETKKVVNKKNKSSVKNVNKKKINNKNITNKKKDINKKNIIKKDIVTTQSIDNKKVISAVDNKKNIHIEEFVPIKKKVIHKKKKKKLKKKNILILFIILIFIIGIILLLINYFKTTIIITLNQADYNKIKLNEEYHEYGASAKSCKHFKCSDITNLLKITGEIDSTIVKEYTVNYEVEINKKSYTKKRLIKVVDDIKPTITLIGEKEITLCPNTKYDEEGFNANDNYDGDITNKVIRQENKNNITYTVYDTSKNKESIIRKLNYKDDVMPTITLNGYQTTYINPNQEYIDKGITVSDNCTSEENIKIKTYNNIDNSKVGTYEVTYEVSDESNNISKITRQVIVRDSKYFNTVDKDIYVKELENYIKQKNYNVSVGYYNLTTNYTYLYRNDVIYYGASLVKTVDALYAYEKMTLNNTIKNNVSKAISVSDNNAHKALVNSIGINNLRNYGRNTIGMKNFLTEGNSDIFASTTVNDQITLWKYLYNYINTHDNGNELKNYFINNYKSFIQFDGIPTTMHKYGSWEIWYHDVGIIFSDRPYILSVLTKHGYNNYKNVVSDISKKIYELNQIDG